MWNYVPNLLSCLFYTNSLFTKKSVYSEESMIYEFKRITEQTCQNATAIVQFWIAFIICYKVILYDLFIASEKLSLQRRLKWTENCLYCIQLKPSLMMTMIITDEVSTLSQLMYYNSKLDFGSKIIMFKCDV